MWNSYTRTPVLLHLAQSRAADNNRFLLIFSSKKSSFIYEVTDIIRSFTNADRECLEMRICCQKSHDRYFFQDGMQSNQGG